MSIPPVTIEDLQAFQAKHFQNSTQPLQPENESYDINEDDDGLGYYPDGVKRTLTDEQVRIFRHSEIHALLRERQIRAENEEYARKFETNDEPGAIGEHLSLKKKESTPPDLTDDQVKQETKMAGVKRSADEAESRKPAAERQLTAASDLNLDYSEESTVQQSVPRQAASQFMGRRIISYDD
ncbi:hypothetical protein BDW59DRAFT_125346 [Aspergillus cavernicola]|uniref:FAM192A/Fyv6 N-terminal domain-containing protein n=1 Tax=Aspergillus cavernicola TaxID=176166 RepID=A0ABR4IVK2_9EURO